MAHQNRGSYRGKGGRFVSGKTAHKTGGRKVKPHKSAHKSSHKKK